MNILHFSAGSLNGGAARGAYCLHKGLRNLGVNSNFISNGNNNFKEDNLINLNNSITDRIKFKIFTKLDSLPKLKYPKRKPWIFNNGMTGIDITKLPEYQDADIIHIHWINGLISLKTLKKVNKPVVWTIRDMWPFTGGCHYSMDCNFYEKGCGSCPQLGSKEGDDLSRENIIRKQESIPEKIRLIGISDWITSSAKKSKAFCHENVKTIYNNIDTGVFSPEPKNLARGKLGLNVKDKIILIGANSIKDFYKGFDLFLKALNSISSEKFHLVTFGKADVSLPNTKKLKVTNLGFIDSEDKLRFIYSAADVFVAPSRMDAFGKTLAESMACGTPVVCFDHSGPAEIVLHKQTGYKAQPFKSRDLANGIEWILNLPDKDFEKMQKNGIERINKNFAVDVIACQYIELYKDMLAKIPFSEIRKI